MNTRSLIIEGLLDNRVMINEAVDLTKDYKEFIKEYKNLTKPFIREFEDRIGYNLADVYFDDLDVKTTIKVNLKLSPELEVVSAGRALYFCIGMGFGKVVSTKEDIANNIFYLMSKIIRDAAKTYMNLKTFDDIPDADLQKFVKELGKNGAFDDSLFSSTHRSHKNTSFNSEEDAIFWSLCDMLSTYFKDDNNLRDTTARAKDFFNKYLTKTSLYNKLLNRVSHIEDKIKSVPIVRNPKIFPAVKDMSLMPIAYIDSKGEFHYAKYWLQRDKAGSKRSYVGVPVDSFLSMGNKVVKDSIMNAYFDDDYIGTRDGSFDDNTPIVYHI